MALGPHKNDREYDWGIGQCADSVHVSEVLYPSIHKASGVWNICKDLRYTGMKQRGRQNGLVRGLEKNPGNEERP